MTENYTTGNLGDDAADRTMEKTIAERGLVSADEVAQTLRRGMTGRAEVELYSDQHQRMAWDDTPIGTFRLKIDGSEIVIIKSEGYVDYVEAVEWVDGRKSWFRSWAKRGARQPLELLTPEEWGKLEMWLSRIP